MKKTIEEKIKAIRAGKEMAEMQMGQIEDDQDRYHHEQELYTNLIGQLQAFKICLDVLENY